MAFSIALRQTFMSAMVGVGLLISASIAAHAVEVQKVTSAGGIEAWLVEDHTIPLIAVNFSFDGGTAQDPDGQEGLTRLLSSALDEGAGDMTAAEFKTRLEDLSVSIGFSADRDRFYGTLRTLTPTRDEAFALLRLAMTEPRFEEEGIERIKARMLSGIKRQETDPNSIAGKALVASLFSGHTYERHSGGTEASLPNLSRDGLDNQRKRILTKDTLHVGVVGAIDADSLATLLDKTFGSLAEKGNLTDIKDVTPAIGERIAKTLDVPQTSILMTLEGLKRDDPDFIPAFVMNHILGGGTFTSWMFEEVREKRGLTYSVGTSLAPYEHTGLLMASASTRPDRADEAVDVMLAQLEKMGTVGPTQEELDSAKRFLTGSYALRFDSSGKIASQLVGLQNADLGIDYFDTRNSKVEAVSLEDIKRVAKRLLENKTPTIVTVGPNPGQ
ncbi:peptidase M16 domain protein [Roseibium sp. TrichSKD4]|uniref:M16 family metallopeptidase n=1 Tax=Roseibium sp. TrichSKD4 TaxID=744980 RepID=UPI0001E562E9|nr:pitrilysin family protein [Roseibium sp. TrichSKD4]EFO34523.1 peptidase M16 domain protein [Roseibium sp. TrichSKD4]